MVTIAGMTFDYPTVIAAGIALLVIILFTIIIAATQKKVKAAARGEAQQKKVTLQCITAMVNSIDCKDPYSKGHSLRVAE